jgi:hypothetical protein
MLNWTGQLLHLEGDCERVHHIILLSHLVGKATSPSFDLVERELFLVISRLANVYLLVRWKVARSSLRVSREEHHKTPVLDLLDAVVTVLARLDNLMLIEVLLEPMDCLLWPIVPAGIHPLLARGILPNTIDLSDDGFPHIIEVRKMNPIT